MDFIFLWAYNLPNSVIEELAQETFFSTYNALNSYDEKKSSFASWLFTIAKNIALNEIARFSYLKETSIETQDLSNIVFQQDAFVTLELKQMSQKLKVCLEKLPEIFKNAIVFAYIEELALDDIAQIEKVPIGTVKSRIHRAKTMLLSLLNDEDIL